MILKGSQRGGGRQLAVHLLNEGENEHVRVHAMRGFVSDDLADAFHEAYAVSRGTRAKQFLFSLSLNPPRDQHVSTKAFERAIEQAERKLGLQDQPRAIVFHEKEGRRHAHAVWSRIDATKMKAIELPHYKLKLRDLAKDLYREHGWPMPRGFIDAQERDPASYSLAEWQQAKRAGHDPKALKAIFQECWTISDSGKGFAAALSARGYTLAQGDQRGHVAVDFRGEVYAIAKYVGVKAKAVRNKLGDAATLPSAEDARRDTAARMTEMLQRHIGEVEADLREKAAAMAARKREIVLRQRQQRDALEKAHATRQAQETRERAARFAKGLRGLWDRLTGTHAKIKARNQAETARAGERDRGERDRVVFQQLDERRGLHRDLKQERHRQTQAIAALHQDIAAITNGGDAARLRQRDAESRDQKLPSLQNETRRGKGPDRER